MSHLGIAGDESLVREIEIRWFDHVDCEVYPDVLVTLSEVEKVRFENWDHLDRIRSGRICGLGKS